DTTMRRAACRCSSRGATSPIATTSLPWSWTRGTSAISSRATDAGGAGGTKRVGRDRMALALVHAGARLRSPAARCASADFVGLLARGALVLLAAALAGCDTGGPELVPSVAGRRELVHAGAPHTAPVTDPAAGPPPHGAPPPPGARPAG